MSEKEVYDTVQELLAVTADEFRNRHPEIIAAAASPPPPPSPPPVPDFAKMPIGEMGTYLAGLAALWAYRHTKE